MSQYNYKQGPYEPTFESLYKFECPEWFRDAKIGIWSHWGAQSVPMYGDWYARNMYIQGHPQYLYHIRNYGHPSKFGYKDLVKLWKAENFDPEGLMDLYVKAGAKYFFGQAMHHDNFFNYDSKVQPFNSVNYGPRKDILAMWQAAAKKRGLKFGISEHLGASFEWLNTNKGCDATGPYKGVPYDGNDKAFEKLYLDNAEYLDLTKPRMHYTLDKRWPAMWYEAIKEVVDVCKPDMLYSDGAVPFYRKGATTADPTYESGLSLVAHMYNSSVAENGINQTIYMQKDSRKEFYDIGVLDIERSLEPGIKEKPWQTDTCLGEWFYDVRAQYKTYQQVISLLVDIVSKNGNLLLNIPQRPDGTIDDECRFVLDKMSEWIAICGEGIYETRPYDVFGEGPSQMKTEKSVEGHGTSWTDYDYRFTKKDNIIYAFVMGRPFNAVIHSIKECDSIKNVRLLGVGKMPFSKEFGVLTVHLPDRLPLDTINCLAIEIDA